MHEGVWELGGDMMIPGVLLCGCLLFVQRYLEFVAYILAMISCTLHATHAHYYAYSDSSTSTQHRETMRSIHVDIISLTLTVICLKHTTASSSNYIKSLNLPKTPKKVSSSNH
jgi:hypothetical protein